MERISFQNQAAVLLVSALLLGVGLTSAGTALEVQPVNVIVLTEGEPGPVAEAAGALGAEVTWTYGIIDGFAASVPPAALPGLTALPGVERVTPDRPVTPLMDVSSRAIEADKAWAAGLDGSGITVAVIDTGIDMLHPFFAGAIVSCVSTIGGLTSPECQDSDGHGTHVAGTVASRDSRYPGIAPGASLAAVRVLHAVGTGLSSDIIAGIEWVADNKDNVNPPIRVATMSIGFLDPGCGDDSSPEAQAANALVAAGVTFTVAAGNSGHNSCTIDGASAASEVITVAAVDDKDTITQEDDEIADFSSGGGSELAKPDISFPGVDITSAFIGGGALVATFDGTSMATPHAAGTAALLYQQDPSRSPDQVEGLLVDNAVKNAHTGASWNSVYGHGLGNACEALGLQGCSETTPPPDPTTVHVSAVDLTSAPSGKKGTTVTVIATVVDDTGAPVEGVTVTLELTAPNGRTSSGSDTTDAAGDASYTKRQNNASGTWQGCVLGVSGTNIVYERAANAETCDTIVV